MRNFLSNFSISIYTCERLLLTRLESSSVDGIKKWIRIPVDGADETFGFFYFSFTQRFKSSLVQYEKKRNFNMIPFFNVKPIWAQQTSNSKKSKGWCNNEKICHLKYKIEHNTYE